MTKCDYLPSEYIWTTKIQIYQSGAPGGGAVFQDRLTCNKVESVWGFWWEHIDQSCQWKMDKI